MKQIKAVQYGCGRIGMLCIRYMLEKGIQVVGAIDTNPAILGKDIGDLCEIGYKTGICVQENAEEVLDTCKPDIAIITIVSDPKILFPHIKCCVERGIDVITSSNRFQYPWDMDAEYANLIHGMCIESGATFTASGSQEGCDFNIIRGLATGIHKIDKIKADFVHDTEPYGMRAVKEYGIGLEEEVFWESMGKELNSEDAPPSYVWGLCRGFAALFGWTMKSICQEVLPYLAQQDTYSAVQDKTIPAGCVIGLIERVTLTSYQGPVVEINSICKVLAEGEKDYDAWEITGEPNTRIVLEDLQTPQHTAAGIVNRIITVLEAEPGVKTLDQLPMSDYLSYPISMYL